VAEADKLSREREGAGLSLPPVRRASIMQHAISVLIVSWTGFWLCVSDVEPRDSRGGLRHVGETHITPLLRRQVCGEGACTCVQRTKALAGANTSHVLHGGSPIHLPFTPPLPAPSSSGFFSSPPLLLIISCLLFSSSFLALPPPSLLAPDTSILPVARSISVSVCVSSLSLYVWRVYIPIDIVVIASQFGTRSSCPSVKG